MPSVDLNACEAELREKFLRGRRAYEEANPGKLLRVTCTHRSAKEQWEAWKIGRTFGTDGISVLKIDSGRIVTKVDGRTKLSKHNYFPSKAIDFCVTVAGKVTWDPSYYQEVGPHLEAEGLRWGGNFDMDPNRKDPWVDYPHVELP